MGADFGSKAKLPPESCSNENSSSGGNLIDASSDGTASEVDGAESRAAHGSFEAFLRGEGLGLGTFGSASALTGLPRRIGVISGIVCFSSVGGPRNAPAIGGDAMLGSGEGKC